MTAETLSADALKMQKLEELKKLRRESERLQQLEARLKYSTDPAEWVKGKLNEHLWSMQVQILESIRDNRRTAVQACHGWAALLSANGDGDAAARVLARALEIEWQGTARRDRANRE